MSSFIPKSLNPLAGAKALSDAVMPKAPEMQAASASPPPVIEDTQAKQQEAADMLRRRRGRAASILTAGNAGTPTTAAKALLGQ